MKNLEWFKSVEGKRIVVTEIGGSGRYSGRVVPGSLVVSPYGTETFNLEQDNGVLLPRFTAPSYISKNWLFSVVDEKSNTKAKPDTWPHTCRCGAPGLMLFSSFDCSRKCGIGR